MRAMVIILLQFHGISISLYHDYQLNNANSNAKTTIVFYTCISQLKRCPPHVVQYKGKLMIVCKLLLLIS